MRTVKEVEEKIKSAKEFDLLGFCFEVLALYLPLKILKPLCAPSTDFTGVRQLPLDEESVKKDMLDYLAFAWEKCIDHRGISASRSIQKMEMWMWLLGDDELEKMCHEGDNYAPYGAPILAAISNKYGFAIPDSESARNMAKGQPCSAECDQCGS